jgi:hypothetical protein
VILNKQTIVSKSIPVLVLLNLGILILILLKKLFYSPSINILDLLLYIIFNVIFFYGIYLNLIWVLKNKKEKKSIIFNLCYFGFQIFTIKIFGIIYYIDTTINLGIFLIENNKICDFGYNVRLINFAYSFYFTNDTNSLLGINFSALILFVILKWNFNKK